MQRALELAPDYPEDITFMMISVFESEFQPFESFQLFQYFGPRLRQLKTYLDSRQPQTLLQLWRDGRDARSWWIFWAFMLFVGVNLL